MLRHKTKNGEPVFSDPGGKRWRRVWLTLACACMALGLTGTWLTCSQLAPLWVAQQHQSATYPNALAEAMDKTPIVGTGLLTRVDLVWRSGGKTYLTDPFTGLIARQATDDEVQQIGSSTTVIEHYGQLGDHQLALTFDDGPSAQYTPQLLDILSKNHVPATFFTIGVNALNNRALVQRMIREGHMVGNHTMTHVEFDNHGSVRDREELVSTDRLLRSIAGYETRIFRLPYGGEEENPLGLLIAQQLGYEHIGYDIDTLDWERSPKQPIPVPALDGHGHIVLMHDSGGDRHQTLILVQKLIDAARAQGYTFVTVAPLLAQGYQPTATAATTTDHIASLWLRFGFNGWRVILGWVLRFGIVSAAGLSALYIVLALLKTRRQKELLVPAATPSVAIVLPACTEELVIRDTLDTLQTSTYPNYRVILVENGSRDHTFDVATAYAATWPRLRVVRAPAGKARALNIGIAEATDSEVVVMVDADTRPEPNALRNLVAPFADPTVGAVAGNIKVGNKGVLPYMQSNEYMTGIAVTRTVEGVVVAPGAFSAFRREALIQVGGVKGDTSAEDCDLTLALHRAGWRVMAKNDAIAWTEAPETLKALWGQRIRWAYGTLQAFWKNRAMFFRPRYGWLGMYVLPYALLSLIMSMIFLPVMYLTIAMSLMTGNWRGCILYTLLTLGISYATTLTAVRMDHERMTRLLVVPLSRFLYEPLRTVIMYATVLRIIRGSLRWYSPERKNSVRVAMAPSMVTT